MSYYCVKPMSRKSLRFIAQLIRKILGFEDSICVPIVHLLDILCNIFGKKFSYELVPDENMEQGKHAETDITTGHIIIRESVYDGACEGKGRDRMTIAHEIAHFILICVFGLKLTRCYDKDYKLYTDPEWQAMCFAGEFMIDYDLT